MIELKKFHESYLMHQAFLASAAAAAATAAVSNNHQHNIDKLGSSSATSFSSSSSISSQQSSPNNKLISRDIFISSVKKELPNNNSVSESKLEILNNRNKVEFCNSNKNKDETTIFADDIESDSNFDYEDFDNSENFEFSDNHEAIDKNFRLSNKIKRKRDYEESESHKKMKINETNFVQEKKSKSFLITDILDLSSSTNQNNLMPPDSNIKNHFNFSNAFNKMGHYAISQQIQKWQIHNFLSYFSSQPHSSFYSSDFLKLLTILNYDNNNNLNSSDNLNLKKLISEEQYDDSISQDRNSLNNLVNNIKPFQSSSHQDEEIKNKSPSKSCANGILSSLEELTKNQFKDFSKNEILGTKKITLTEVKSVSDDVKTETTVIQNTTKILEPDLVRKTKHDLNEKLTSSNSANLWPAWVYCTRYSDRPSAGPRHRKKTGTSIRKSSNLNSSLSSNIAFNSKPSNKKPKSTSELSKARKSIIDIVKSSIDSNKVSLNSSILSSSTNLSSYSTSAPYQNSLILENNITKKQLHENDLIDKKDEQNIDNDNKQSFDIDDFEDNDFDDDINNHEYDDEEDENDSNGSHSKRPRTAFTSSQLNRLKFEFEKCKYLTGEKRQYLANELNLNESQIKIWFQNKRAKIKKSSGDKSKLALQLMAQGLYNHGGNGKGLNTTNNDIDDINENN